MSVFLVPPPVIHPRLNIESENFPFPPAALHPKLWLFSNQSRKRNFNEPPLFISRNITIALGLAQLLVALPASYQCIAAIHIDMQRYSNTHQESLWFAYLRRVYPFLSLGRDHL
jgi:hypothetical protein